MIEMINLPIEILILPRARDNDVSEETSARLASFQARSATHRKMEVVETKK